MSCMKMANKKILVLVFASLFCACPPAVLHAQENETPDSPSMLFRGRLARRYDSHFNGTPYWDTLSFRKGTVMYNGRLYNDVLVRIDASLGKLVVRQNENMAPTTPDERQVSWFTRGNELYVNLSYQGIEGGGVFYRLMCDSAVPVFKQVVKTRRTDSGNHNGAYIGYSDPEYNPAFVDFFESNVYYWKLEDGRLVKLRPKKAAKLIASAVPDGSFSNRLAGWHPVSGTGSELVAPSIKRARVTGIDGLPLGYFSEETVSSFVQENADARYKNKVYEIGTRGTNPRATIKGLVTDDDSAPLESVIIVDESTGIYTQTDSRGRFSITLPVGETSITFSDPEKEVQKLSVILNGDGGLNVSLHDRATMLDEAMISAESMRQHRSSDIGVEKISAKTLSKIPTVFGEGDILKVVMTLPGVQTVGEASAGFNVRGGSTDQNLILYNGNTIYYPTHFFGVNSVFNPDMVENIELYKGSIPAEFGGRISSVLDVKARSGDPLKVKGSMGLGVLTSRLHLEGPLGKVQKDSLGHAEGARTTFNAGARTSYSDWIIGLIPPDSEFSGGSAGFYDANLGITHKPDAHNTIQLFGYMSSDRFRFGQDTSFNYSNANASLHWTHSTDSLSMKASAGFDHYGNRIEEQQNISEAYILTTAINQAFARFDLKRKIRSGHTLDGGAEAVFYMLDGGRRQPMGYESLVIPDELPRETALQPSVYFSDTWQPSSSIAVDAGVRLAAYMADNVFKAYPEIRLSGRYSFTPVLSLKAGFNTMSQYIHLISNTTSISPMDTWKMTDKDIRPTTGWQAASGLYWTVFGGKVDLSAETYYKQLHDYLDYGQGAVLVMNPDLAGDLVRTRGKSYGVEFMARKSTGRLNGWISYTWSRSFLQDIQYTGLSAINGGMWYRSSTDKPHDFKLVGNYAFTRRYSISLNVDYSTGRPVTFPVGYYTYSNGYRLAYSLRNGYRIPDYFRMDFALNIDPGHYLKALAHASFTIGCYNITGRRNAYSVFYDTNRGKSLQAYKLSIFASQVPYVNLNILF